MNQIEMKTFDTETGTSGPAYRVDMATPEEVERLLLEAFTAPGVEEAMIHGIMLPREGRSECYRKVMERFVRKVTNDRSFHQSIKMQVFSEYHKRMNKGDK
jgi:hypothetical protein